MSDTTIWISLAVNVLAFIAWIVWEQQPEKVTFVNGLLVKKYKGRSESIVISDLVEIKYHYHAVVGFISTWEFNGKDGGSLRVDGEAKGISEVLSQLEKILPTFSLSSFETQFDAGDVEDTIDVWRNA
ncbi:MAG: hypothetical protein PVJ68_06295 [Candidatus Thiodiazotropha sp.]|jgi:hypothetical protein